jgi:hypothetical protein
LRRPNRGSHGAVHVKRWRDRRDVSTHRSATDGSDLADAQSARRLGVSRTVPLRNPRCSRASVQSFDGGVDLARLRPGGATPAADVKASATRRGGEVGVRATVPCHVPASPARATTASDFAGSNPGRGVHRPSRDERPYRVDRGVSEDRHVANFRRRSTTQGRASIYTIHLVCGNSGVDRVHRHEHVTMACVARPRR